MDRQRVIYGLSVAGAFALGLWLGNDSGRTKQVYEDLQSDQAIQAYSDCILIRGKDACVPPAGYPK